MEPSPQSPRSPPRREATNWLRRTEQRRLFWTWMPPALLLLLLAGQVERVLVPPPAVGRGGAIDTVLASGAVTRTIDDAVTIEAAPAPTAVAPDGAEALAASREVLDRVRDDTVFRTDDGPAWFAIWKGLAEEAAGARPAPRGRRVSFAQLFEQPGSFRGRRIRFEGTIRRLQEVPAPANDAGIERTWQAWVEPAGGPPAPIVVYFLSVPGDMPTGMRVDVPAIVDGVFFKRWAYPASDAIRLAPLVLAAAPLAAPRIESGSGTSSLVGWALISIVVVVGGTAAALRLAAPPRRRRTLPERVGIADGATPGAGAES